MREARNQIFSHYESWEHWIAGMFGPTLRDPVVGECISLLMSPEAFESVLEEVAVEWPNAVAQHLSNANQNHQPWCGRLACGYEFGASIREVNHAWFALGGEDQARANAVADRFTLSWRAANLDGQIGLPI
jgi:hypothetical protein